jgi:hypothetical protein
MNKGNIIRQQAGKEKRKRTLRGGYFTKETWRIGKAVMDSLIKE